VKSQIQLRRGKAIKLILPGGGHGGGSKGTLLTGDIIQVVPDRKHVSFMYKSHYTILEMKIMARSRQHLPMAP